MKNQNVNDEMSDQLRVLQDEMKKNKPSSRSGLRSGQGSKKVLNAANIDTNSKPINPDIKNKFDMFKPGAKLPNAKHVISDTNQLVEKRLTEIRSKYKNEKITEINNSKHLGKPDQIKTSNLQSLKLSQSNDYDDKENDSISTSQLKQINSSISNSNSLDKNQYQPIELTTDQKQILDILKTVNMADQITLIIENGFDDLDTFLELNLDHMQTIDIPLGFRIKLDKAIKQFKSKSTPDNTSNPNSLLVKPATKIQYEELSFDHAEVDKRIYSESDADLGTNRPKAEMVDGGYQNGTDKVIIIKNAKYNPELDGEQDEEKNEKEFKEALEAVRGATKIAKPKEVKLGKKFSCQNCFKLVHEDNVLKSFDKYLCSDQCLEIVEKSCVDKCANCDVKCLKSNLYFIGGSKVCSEECRKQMELVETNESTDILINPDEEIKKSGEVLAKSKELNSELNRLRRMQEEIDYLKKKHDDIKVDMNIDLSRFDNDQFDPYK